MVDGAVYGSVVGIVALLKVKHGDNCFSSLLGLLGKLCGISEVERLFGIGDCFGGAFLLRIYLVMSCNVEEKCNK